MPNIPLLDRYLQFAANFLPTTGREDILAELRANLQSEFDDRAESLGRPLTEDEIAAILKQHGHPMAIASRYFPQQFLIGPSWIATYWLTLKLALAAAATVTLAVSLFAVALDRISSRGLLTSWLSFPNTALIVFAWVTLVFIVIDYCTAKCGPSSSAHNKENWDPRKLPAFTLGGKGTSRKKPISDFIAALIGLLVLLAIVQNWRIFFPGDILQTLRFSPAFRPFYEISLAVACLRIITSFVQILRPDWPAIRPVTNIISNLASLAAFRLLFVGGPWLMVQPGGKYYPALGIANTVIFWCVAGSMLGLTIATIVEIWQSIHVSRKPGSGGNGNSAASTPLSC